MRAADYPYKAIEASGYLHPVIKTELNSYAPLHYDDLMFIHTLAAPENFVEKPIRRSTLRRRNLTDATSCGCAGGGFLYYFIRSESGEKGCGTLFPWGFNRKIERDYEQHSLHSS